MARKKKKKEEKKMGFGFDESKEKAEAEQMKSASGTETISYEDRDSSTTGIETYDSKTGKKEGIITLGVGDYLDLRFTDNNGQDVWINLCNFNIVRIM